MVLLALDDARAGMVCHFPRRRMGMRGQGCQWLHAMVVKEDKIYP